MLNTFNHPTKRQSQSGFTMIELLVVVTIIIVLTTIGLISYRQVGINARNGKRKADMETLRQSLVLYRSDEGTYPDTSNFDDMVTEISEYVSQTNFTDPKGADDATYLYSYTSDGSDFTLNAVLEPDETDYSLSSP